MDYNHIKNYLEKFKNILSSKEDLYRVISNIIEKNISIKIENKNIQIKGPVVYIKASPLIRGEILIHKEKILLELSQLPLSNNFIDIR